MLSVGQAESIAPKYTAEACSKVGITSKWLRRSAITRSSLFPKSFFGGNSKVASWKTLKHESASEVTSSNEKFFLNYEATGKEKMPNIHELHYMLLANTTLHISTNIITIWSVVLLR